MLNTGFGAHKPTILALRAQIRHCAVSTSYPKIFTGAYLQYISSRILVEFYFKAAYKWPKSFTQTFRQDFEKKTQFFANLSENCGAT